MFCPLLCLMLGAACVSLFNSEFVRFPICNILDAFLKHNKMNAHINNKPNGKQSSGLKLSMREIFIQIRVVGQQLNLLWFCWKYRWILNKLTSAGNRTLSMVCSEPRSPFLRSPKWKSWQKMNLNNSHKFSYQLLELVSVWKGRTTRDGYWCYLNGLNTSKCCCGLRGWCCPIHYQKRELASIPEVCIHLVLWDYQFG